MPTLTAAGVRVYALSYDEQAALTDFANAYEIDYRFLSDPDSVVIRQFGILNTIISEDDHPWFGIPYPGTYVLNAAGEITHKFFENNLAVRVGPDQLVRAVAGEPMTELSADTSPPLGEDASAQPAAVQAEVFLAGDELAVSVQSELVARFTVPDGRHLYAKPAPAGSVAVSIELDPTPGLVLREVIRPASELHTLSDTGERFPVHQGRVELRLPLTVNGDAFAKGAEGKIRLSGKLRWQSCDDAVCDIPMSQPFELLVPLDGGLTSVFVEPKGKPAREPRGQAHFQQMIERRTPS